MIYHQLDVYHRLDEHIDNVRAQVDDVYHQLDRFRNSPRVNRFDTRVLKLNVRPCHPRQ